MKPLLLAIFLLLARPSVVGACSCGSLSSSPRSPQDVMASFNSTNLVFEGRVIDIHENNSIKDVTFEVSQIWKGNVHETMSVTTNMTTDVCGFPFSLDDKYLVYCSDAAPNGALPYVGLCSPTALTGDAEVDYRVLGIGRAPLSRQCLILTLLGVLALSAGLPWGIRRFRKGSSNLLG